MFYFKNIMRRPYDVYRRNNIAITAKFSGNVMIARSSVGQYTYIACNTVINNTQIGNYCSIAPGVQIGGMEHSHWWLSTSTSLSDKCSYDKRVIIGNDVWIAAGAIVKQGVKIGHGSVVGALSFVNTDIPENVIVMGTPARFYKYRMDPDKFEKLKATNYWNYNVDKAKDILKNFDSSR